MVDREKKTKRQEILDRLNSRNEELNEDALQSEKETERKRRYEREREMEWGRRTAAGI
ncbi:MAG: hypothetical protein WA982_09965 [Rubrobacteraceae bacterium]